MNRSSFIFFSAYFSHVVKVMYNLLYYQVVVQVISALTPEERSNLAGKQSSGSAEPSSDTILATVFQYLSESQFFWDDSEPKTSKRSLEVEIQSLCLPFLRIASLLRYHLYGQQLPLIRSPQTEFVRLVYYLELVTEGMDWDCFNAAVALNWQDDEASVTVPRLWCEQFIAFSNTSVMAARRLIIDQHISYQSPKLLRLPREYEKIFTYYHERQCRKCHSVPPEISICLLCGTIVCLKTNCCKRQNVGEAVQVRI